MEICQYQYLNDIVLDIDADEALLDCQMPPMVLQPIVENAIIHGITDFRSDGVIRISARREDQTLILRVVDNGHGMSPEQIAALLQQERNTDKRRFSGIGLFNVYKRIHSPSRIY
jgi:sensor histidine kinase YesM